MFERLEVPTPFGVGPVNAYLRGRALVDPGPDTEDAWETLRLQLRARELAPRDVETVLLTHPHPDHVGLAGRLRERGATIVASPVTASILEDVPARLSYEGAYFREFLPEHGMPRTVAETIADHSSELASFVPSCPVDHVLEDGERIDVGSIALTAGFTTGHAPEEVLFEFDAGDERWALVGDHVLGEITPNPLLEPPREPGTERPRAVPAYNESLRTLRERSFDRFFPGHGPPIENPSDRIDRILEAHETRTERVFAAVDGPTTAYDVMFAIFGDLPVVEQFGGMSEAIGHLDVLEERGRVQRVKRDGTVRYESAP